MTLNLLLHICDFSVHMQNKYLRLQIYCYTFVILEYTSKINIYDFKFTVTHL